MGNFNFYTIEEVAKILKVNPMTIYRVIKKGDIRPIKIGNLYRISEKELKAFIRKNQK